MRWLGRWWCGHGTIRRTKEQKKERTGNNKPRPTRPPAPRLGLCISVAGKAVRGHEPREEITGWSREVFLDNGAIGLTAAKIVTWSFKCISNSPTYTHHPSPGIHGPGPPLDLREHWQEPTQDGRVHLLHRQRESRTMRLALCGTCSMRCEIRCRGTS